jgi:phage terminase large subunit-like protein
MTVLEIPTPRVFVPLLDPARYKGAYGGRGSGKSHNFAEMLVERCLEKKGTRAVCLREVQKTLRESAKRLIEDKIQHFDLGKKFDCQNDRIITPGDGVIIFQGLQDHTAESIKSLEGFHIAWCEEAQTLSSKSLEMLRPTMRAGSELWFSWNPRRASDPVDQLLRGNDLPERTIVVKANYNDNPFLPLELEEERTYDYKHKPDRYAHIWLGEYEPMALGAIWTRQVIEENRRTEVPDLKRILVSVDPAVTNTDGSDEHGIMAGGIGEDRRGYLLEDASCHGSPQKWAQRAVAMYDKYDADAVVIEVNQGGDMVRSTLQTIRPNLPIIEVRASRGKHVRAEPIAAEYAMGRISHIGTFPELESQMCLMTSAGYEGEGSPDRVDALVWLFTELFPAMNRKAAPPDMPKTTGNLKWRR